MRANWPAFPVLAILPLLSCGPAPAPPVAPVVPAPTPTPTVVETPPAPVGPPSLQYPTSERQYLVDTLHDEPVADPYRWLEDGGDERVQAWMKAQDDIARAELAKLPTREAFRARLQELYYYDDISAPIHRGGRYFYTRRHKDKEKRVVYWKEGEAGQEKVLLDPNGMSDDGSVSLGGWWPSYDGKKVAYKLSENNADAATMYLLDVDSGATSKTTGAESKVDVIAGAKYAGASWTPDNKGFYYTKLPEDPNIPVAEMPGKAHVRYHKLGQTADQDEVVFGASNNPKQFVSAGVSRDGRWLMLSISHGWNATDVYFKDLRQKWRPAVPKNAPAWQASGFKPLVTGVPALFSVRVWKNQFYVLTNHEAPRYRVFKVSPLRPQRRFWKEIVPQGEAVLDGMQVIGGHLVLSYLRDAHGEMEVRTLNGVQVRQVKLPGIGSSGGMVGDPDRDEAYYYYSSFVEPPQIFKTSIKSGETSQWAKVEFPVDTSKMTVEQVRYASKDGTQIPMFIIRNKDAAKDGLNPTILYGYGGFNINMTPRFSTSIAAWLERGGIYAIANLRGGGEFGEEWHKAGMLLSKQNVFDDFIYAAKHLIAEGWTKPEKLAIRGGSNGGLLVGAAMTQAPELFGAVVCAVPLLDMVRYHLFGSGKTWIPEYGSADDEAQFRALYAYSPYHRVRKDVSYPALLMMSADSDDRVDPMHARKFTAQIQWATSNEKPVLLRIERHAGHGGADLVKQQVEQNADMYAFLAAQLGM